MSNITQNERYPCLKREIIPEFSKEDFLRSAWISFIKDDAPIEIFESDFENVSLKQRYILCDYQKVMASYEASIGFDREEPYLDYETYFESEPYLTTERYYDTDVKAYRERYVTKYRKVQKERPVTKYKTVTDWSITSGEREAVSCVYVDNDCYDFAAGKFEDAFDSVSKASVVEIPDSESKKMKINDGAHYEADSLHRSYYENFIVRSLQGDHKKDVRLKIDEVDRSSTLYKVPEYVVSISFEGETYTKRAFPFGSMEIYGNKIKNRANLKDTKADMKSKMQDEDKRLRSQSYNTINRFSAPAYIMSILMSIGSIAVSFLSSSVALVIVAFAIALGSFVFCNLYINSRTKKENFRLSQELKALAQNSDLKIENYENDYKSKMKKALNDKLKSLGLATLDGRKVKEKKNEN